MIAWIQGLWAAILRWFGPDTRPLHTVKVEELPDVLQSDTLYIAGQNEYLWFAAMRCPCGCGDTIQLNLMPQANPCWNIVLHEDQSASLRPSVWRQQGCKSHFWVRHGQIDWCPPMRH